jgi:hypothetical protein
MVPRKPEIDLMSAKSDGIMIVYEQMSGMLSKAGCRQLSTAKIICKLFVQEIIRFFVKWHFPGYALTPYKTLLSVVLKRGNYRDLPP